MLSNINNFMNGTTVFVGNAFMAVVRGFDIAMRAVTFLSAIAAFSLLAVVVLGVSWIIAVDVLPWLWSLVFGS